MSKEGWPVNAASFVQPNVLPMADRRVGLVSTPPPLPPRLPVDELVFFARLETRKASGHIS
jgi:hypothetical protein